MTQFKKSKVVMLPTEKASESTIFKSKWGLFRGSSIDINDFNKGDKSFQPQHLYILSDEEIKEGDWYYVDGSGNNIMLCKNSNQVKGIAGYYKIIATTDSSLTINEFLHHSQDLMKIAIYKDKQLPRPSDSFIKKYCELGGIDEVLVEYESLPVGFEESEDQDGKYQDTIYQDFIKIATDNTITIKKVKDSWNKEELIELLNNYTESIRYDFSYPIRQSILSKRDKWIEENL